MSGPMDNAERCRERCRRISNTFYNAGLEKARIRDLTGAAQCLKKSLHFDKYHTDARNLLGLIYYETGETAEALVQWVISSNLRPGENRAFEYLKEIQGRPGVLEDESVHIRKYNQAVRYAKTDNPDLALLQLRRVVEHKPNFIKAHMLLALLYMGRGDYVKAGQSLYQVLQIDRNNPRASWYMSIVKKNTRRGDVERKKLLRAFSHREMEDDDVILPPTYKETTGWQAVLQIAAGLLMGAAVIFFLVMPAREEQLQAEHNQELNQVLEQVNRRSIEIDRLEAAAESLREERDDAEAKLQAAADENSSVLSQYRRLIEILQAYRSGDIQTAAELYPDLDTSAITDEGILTIVADIRTDMEASGYQVLADLGNRARDAGDSDRALWYYQKSLDIHSDNVQVLYDMAMVYHGRGEEEEANRLFGQVIVGYPDSEQAARARETRGY